MDSRQHKLFALLGTAMALFTANSTVAQKAPSAQEKPLWELGIGGGALVQPHYPGSSERQTRGLVLPYVIYRGDILRIGDGQSARAVAAENNRYELSLSFDAAFDANSEDNERRLGMPDLDYLFEVGPQVRFKLDERKYSDTSRSELLFAPQFRAAFSTDFRSIDHRGYVFEPNLRYRHYGLFDPRFEATVSLSPMWVSRDLHGYFYDVDAKYATTDRSEYQAKSGYFGTGLSFYGTWHFTDETRLFLGLQTHWHQGAVNRDSPLFEKDFTYGFGAGVIWSPFKSQQTVTVP